MAPHIPHSISFLYTPERRAMQNTPHEPIPICRIVHPTKVYISSAIKVSRLLQRPGVPVALLNYPLDSHVLAVEVHLLAILCGKKPLVSQLTGHGQDVC